MCVETIQLDRFSRGIPKYELKFTGINIWLDFRLNIDGTQKLPHIKLLAKFVPLYLS